jgi:hypothetical protein
MLSDATSVPHTNRDVSAEPADDFEWVNAWAAAMSSSKPAPEPVPQGTALVQELAHIPATQPRAAEAVAVELISPEQNETPGLATPVAMEPEGTRAQPIASEPADAPIAPAATVLMSVAATPVEQDVQAAMGPLEIPAVDDPSGLASVAPLESDIEAAAPTLADDVNASTSAPELVELIDEQPAPADERASAPISFLDFASRAKRWRNLFGIARKPSSEPLDPLAALPTSSDPIATDADAADAVALLELAPAIAPDQLELDIAEIEVRRDALFIEWEQERHMTATPPASAAPAAWSRTTDHVPILLGCVLGFTLLVVFGAAASFVSLR